MGDGSNGLTLIEYFCPSSQSWTFRKKIVCIKKFTMLRSVCGFPQFSFLNNFNHGIFRSLEMGTF